MGIAVLLLFITIHCREKGKMIEAWTKAVIIWMLVAYFSLEILSVFSAVTFLALACLWGVLDLSLAIALFKKKTELNVFFHSVVGVLRRNKIWFALSLGLIILSIWTVPYNWDSMTYHLSRIASWAQNRSVAHYATHNIRQLSSPVLAEFVNLHVYILAGKRDLFVNLLQCFSGLMNMWLVYEIARKIGCSKVYAQLAAFLFFTSPSMFGEALTTQVDQFASLWLLIFVYFWLDLFRREYRFKWDADTINKCILMGICLALGYLAKPSVLIGAAVLALVLLIRCIMRKDAVGILIKLLLCVLPVIAVIMAPELIRNMLSFGAISTPEVGKRQLIGTLRPLYVLVNGLKNFTFNLPNIYLYKSDQWIAAIVYRLAGILGVAIDEPDISEDGRLFELHEAGTYEPDMAVNAVISLWFIAAAVWGIWRYRKQKNQLGKEYALLASVIFLLFCCAVRWEPFVSRYMISYLGLLCPMIAFELEDFGKSTWKYRNYALPLIVFMCCVELFGLGLYHANIAWREGKDRFAGYFRNNRGLYAEYNEVCGYLENAGQGVLGLVLGGDSYEYPIWARLDDHIGEICHIMVQNESAKYEKDDFIPAYIISDQINEDRITYGEEEYELLGICSDNHVLWLYQHVE